MALLEFFITALQIFDTSHINKLYLILGILNYGIPVCHVLLSNRLCVNIIPMGA